MVHYHQIDGLRAIAVIPVMIVHCWAFSLPGGGIGVDLFFVISGFVITNLLISEFEATGSISIRNFYIRRILRIMPALISVCLAIAAFIIALAIISQELGGMRKFATIALAMTSTMNWARAFDVTGGGMLGHTWSLSVEEQFYFVWPFFLSFLLLKRVSRKRIVAGVCAFILAVILWRAYLLDSPSHFSRVTNGTDTRADEIMIGCAIALSKVRSQGRLLSKLWFFPVLAFIGMMFFSRYVNVFFYQFGYLVIMLSSAWLVVLARDMSVPSFSLLQSKPFLWVGKRSYSLYLWHFPIIVGLEIIGLTGALWGFVTFVISFVIADASYRFVEKPILMIKSRLSPSHAKPATVIG